MLEKIVQSKYRKKSELIVDEGLELTINSLDRLDIVAMADHLNVPISETERQLNTKPFYLYPKDGLFGLL